MRTTYRLFLFYNTQNFFSADIRFHDLGPGAFNLYIHFACCHVPVILHLCFDFIVELKAMNYRGSKAIPCASELSALLTGPYIPAVWR